MDDGWQRLIVRANDALHPLTPQNLADNFVAVGRQSCLKTLIVSWLARSPNFKDRVASLRAFVKTRVDVSEPDLDRLLAYLGSTEPGQ